MLDHRVAHRVGRPVWSTAGDRRSHLGTVNNRPTTVAVYLALGRRAVAKYFYIQNLEQSSRKGRTLIFGDGLKHSVAWDEENENLYAKKIRSIRAAVSMQYWRVPDINQSIKTFIKVDNETWCMFNV